MKYNAADAHMAQKIRESRLTVRQAVQEFSSGTNPSTTIQSLLLPLDLYHKEELMILYQQTARASLRTRVHAGLLTKQGKGTSMRYYKVH